MAAAFFIGAMYTMQIILNMILSVLGLLSKGADIWTRKQDKKAGRNDEKLENIDKIDSRVNRAKSIIDGLRDKSKGDK